jgi:hypothetical protein
VECLRRIARRGAATVIPVLALVAGFIAALAAGNLLALLPAAAAARIPPGITLRAE